DTLAGSNQVALLIGATVAAVIAYRIGIKWVAVMKKIVSTISSAMPSILILLLIGSLAGTWMISGVVPVMIYYGLDIISPGMFLFTAVVVSAIVTFLYNLIIHKVGIVDWETAFRLAIILGIVLTWSNAREKKGDNKRKEQK
ncbi:MAG: hypothetical protein L3J12_00910, partial [Spirochaetales bacterium]|nr:hypothetical protein [Spirochaetales bacterium]